MLQAALPGVAGLASDGRVRSRLSYRGAHRSNGCGL